MREETYHIVNDGQVVLMHVLLAVFLVHMLCPQFIPASYASSLPVSLVLLKRFSARYSLYRYTGQSDCQKR